MISACELIFSFSSCNNIFFLLYRFSRFKIVHPITEIVYAQMTYVMGLWGDVNVDKRSAC